MSAGNEFNLPLGSTLSKTLRASIEASLPAKSMFGSEAHASLGRAMPAALFGEGMLDPIKDAMSVMSTFSPALMASIEASLPAKSMFGSETYASLKDAMPTAIFSEDMLASFKDAVPVMSTFSPALQAAIEAALPAKSMFEPEAYASLKGAMPAAIFGEEILASFKDAVPVMPTLSPALQAAIEASLLAKSVFGLEAYAPLGAPAVHTRAINEELRPSFADSSSAMRPPSQSAASYPHSPIALKRKAKTLVTVTCQSCGEVRFRHEVDDTMATLDVEIPYICVCLVKPALDIASLAQRPAYSVFQGGSEGDGIPSGNLCIVKPYRMQK
jgi:hypothetical protein